MKNAARVAAAMLFIAAMGATAGAVTYTVAGAFNGWNTTSHPMTEIETGLWQVTLTGLEANQRTEFKITDGSWSWNYPSANSWLYAGASGSAVITFNANVVQDGWLPQQYRLGVSTDLGIWTIAGSFNGWNNAAPEGAMTPQGNGLYTLSLRLEPGTYQFKPVVTGTWDSLAADGRSTNTANMSVTTTPDFEIVNFYVDTLAGRVRTEVAPAIDRPHDPYPTYNQTDVEVEGLVLSWSVAQGPSLEDPNVFIAEPNLVSHRLYMVDADVDDDPNDYFVAEIPGWDAETLRASYTPVPELKKGAQYFWRVDMVRNDQTQVKGTVWMFLTETLYITAQPVYQIVDAGAPAAFSVAAVAPASPTYQWYRYVDGISDIALSDGGNLSGAQTDALSIAAVQPDDEGYYYCVVASEGIVVQSEAAPLAIKRKLAHWDFEGGNIHSVVPGSPASVLYGNPAFVPGILGDGLAFSADAGGDLLYTDPNEASYFDICNYEMTVALWVQSSFAATWGPMVARDGEQGMGWQLRHHGGTLDRVCLTTRGTGNDDGRPSNRTVYDGDWHYVVGVFDGKNGLKQVYIDGVASRLYSTDDGSIVADAEQVSGVINAAAAPVALAGRVRGSTANLIIEPWSITPCVLDEVKIYNYALDAATVAQNFADLTGNAVCPVPQAYDLNGDCKVNLYDFALLASEWLSDISVQPAF